MKKQPLQSSPMSLLSTSASNSSKRYTTNSSNLLPLFNGRTMPSKWDDAEKWIFNPISGEAQGASPFLSLNQYRRPMSKSGPLKASSPQLQMRVSEEISKRKSFPASSPFVTGVFMADNGYYRGRNLHGVEGRERGGGVRKSCSSHADQGVVHNAGAHDWSDLSAGSSSFSEISQDDDLEALKASDVVFSPEIQRKDVGTQISPEGSGSSSPKEKTRLSLSSFSPSTSFDQIQHLSKLAIRDVQVDEALVESINRKNNSMVEPRASAWQLCELAKHTSKWKREEAKINDWENLQKAEAEAAIKFLELELEKKRSASMKKIMRDLRSAQEKAQDMRIALAARKSGQRKRTKMKLPICFYGCFTCHAS